MPLTTETFKISNIDLSDATDRHVFPIAKYQTAVVQASQGTGSWSTGTVSIMRSLDGINDEAFSTTQAVNSTTKITGDIAISGTPYIVLKPGTTEAVSLNITLFVAAEQ